VKSLGAVNEAFHSSVPLELTGRGVPLWWQITDWSFSLLHSTHHLCLLTYRKCQCQKSCCEVLRLCRRWWFYCT